MSTNNFSSPSNVPVDVLNLDVLSHIFVFLAASDQESCAKVCMDWLESAGQYTLPLLDVSDQELVHAIQRSPTVARHIRHIIAPINFELPFHGITFIDRILEPPLRFEQRCMAIESLELHGMRVSALPPSAFLVPSIITFSTTLRGFALKHQCQMAPVFFFELLQALGQCKKLESLTLANSAALEPFLESFRMFNLSARGLERPKLEFLQLVSVSHRERPHVLHTASTADYAWLDDELCPFDLHSLKEIIAGSAAPMEILLPTVKDSLVSLEFCCPFDTKESWSDFGKFSSHSDVIKKHISFVEKFRRKPFHLSQLQFFELHFLLSPSSWILDVIHAPMLHSFSLKWVTKIHPHHFFHSFGVVDEKISQLSPGQDYPQHLEYIALAKAEQVESPPATWLARTFRCASDKHINVIVITVM
ncbi:hypothetical protein BT96DRAFT_996067 [Gymnopus androsaceus JB14]|uniref:F-box domain-containing protein n=1 Tax=Gymnopus androsaceus JB14 TaxID=1447944 RepID=A0A6A4HF48_9AGAR|nr:hypothetical protein BT96DRAFT_996067 [Gymnopus androsaceus JB14]